MGWLLCRHEVPEVEQGVAATGSACSARPLLVAMLVVVRTGHQPGTMSAAEVLVLAVAYARLCEQALLTGSWAPCTLLWLDLGITTK